MKALKKLPLMFFIILIAAMAICLIPRSDAFAALPDSYIEQVLDKGYEWWSSEEFLNIDAVKRVVNSWKSSPYYDLSAIKNDPIVVAVIDSGIKLNNDLFSGNGTTGDKASYDVLYRDEGGKLIAQSTLDNRTDLSSFSESVLNDTSSNSHGTHVAGIVAMLIHKLELEEYIKIMPIKAGKPATNGVSFTDRDVEEGVKFALSHCADVVNMSLTSSDNFYNELVSIDRANRAIFVAAAGNNVKNVVRYPAANSRVIGVMNYDSTGGLHSSSNYGTYYDLCAPGTAIYSAINDTSVGKNEYGPSTGTSMATPVVSFAAALATLKFRAMAAKDDSVEISPPVITDYVKNSYSSFIEEGGFQLPKLDMLDLVYGDDGPSYGTIEITDGLQEQYIGNVQAVTMRLNVYPSSLAEAGKISWFVNGEPVAEGQTYTYIPANRAAEINVSATLVVNDEEVVSAEIVLKVNRIKLNTRAEIEAIELVFVDEYGKEFMPQFILPDKQYTLAIKDSWMYDEKQMNNIKWYVNGKFTQETGDTYVFTPPENGTYVISIQLGGISAHSLTIVCDTESYKNHILIIVTASVAAVVALLAIITISVVIAKKIRSKHEN